MDGDGRGPERSQGAAVAATPRRRSRAFLISLLALLWGTVGCIALVLSAALDFESTYEQASAELASPRLPPAVRARALAREAEMQGESDARALAARRSGAPLPWDLVPGSPRSSSRHGGGRPDLATPQGTKLYEGLLVAARSESDSKKRAGAVRSFAGMFGRGASDALTGIADDPTQPAEVRGLAAKASRQNTEGGK